MTTLRLIDNWQYKYIEKSLFNFYKIANSSLETEQLMVKAISKALKFFEGTSHEIMMREYYFNRDEYCKKHYKAKHYNHVCLELLYTEESNGFVIRREIVYRVAMMCYELGLFKS